LYYTLIIDRNSELSVDDASLWRMSSDNRTRLTFFHAAAYLYPYSKMDDGRPYSTIDPLQLTRIQPERLDESAHSRAGSPALSEQALLFHTVATLPDVVRHDFVPQFRAHIRIPLFHRLPLVDFGVRRPLRLSGTTPSAQIGLGGIGSADTMLPHVKLADSKVNGSVFIGHEMFPPSLSNL